MSEGLKLMGTADGVNSGSMCSKSLITCELSIPGFAISSRSVTVCILIGCGGGDSLLPRSFWLCGHIGVLVGD